MSGVGQHDYAALDSLTTGKSVFVDFMLEEQYFSLFGFTNREDVEFGLQLLAARVLDPAFRDSTVDFFRSRVSPYVTGIETSFMGTYNYDVLGWLKGGDGRFVAPTEEGLLSFEAKDATDWLLPALNHSYMECSFVGDFNDETIIDNILATLGALPVRDDAPDILADEASAIEIPFPETKSFPYESQLPQAGAFVAWEIPSRLAGDIEMSWRFGVLKDIFRDRMRLKIREELGGAYSPAVAHKESEGFDYGFLIAVSQGLPEELPIFTDIILAIAGNMTMGDITQDELDRAIQPLQSSFADDLRTNSYWMEVIQESQARVQKIDWARDRNNFYENVALEDINALAQEYLSPGAAFPLSVVPVNETNSDP